MNIAEIAKLAGVSSAAVSRYFNNGYVSEEKREAIQKVVSETGYRPSVQAQTLRTKKTKMIGVIVPKIASASIGRVVEGILSVVNESGYQMLLSVTQNTPEKEIEYLSVFNHKQVDGVILVATVFSEAHVRALKQMKVPVVIVGQELSGFCSVYHDDYHACYELTKHLLERGRTSLGYISAMEEDRAVGRERRRGYRDAVCDMGFENLAERYVIASFSMESGHEKAKELLARFGPLDGLICATDSLAIGAMQYLKESGLCVPEDVLVAGHGDSTLARVTTPPLMTVHYAYEKSGEIAVSMLFELFDNRDAAVRAVRLGFQIVEHEESC